MGASPANRLDWIIDHFPREIKLLVSRNGFGERACGGGCFRKKCARIRDGFARYVEKDVVGLGFFVGAPARTQSSLTSLDLRKDRRRGE